MLKCDGIFLWMQVCTASNYPSVELIYLFIYLFTWKNVLSAKIYLIGLFAVEYINRHYSDFST